jgi:hypothetical protein
MAASGDGADAPTYASAVPALAPPDADVTAIYLDESGQPLIMEEAEAPSAESAALGPCTPYSGRDNPHRSDTGVAVSGHGWWDKGDCSNNLARVYNCIYEYYSDATWRRKDCSYTRELAPGGGRGNRTTARKACDNTLLTSWRNHVDVDVIDEWDSPEKPMRQADVACRVY